MEKWYNDTWMNIVEKLDSNIYKGLRTNQVEYMRNKHGNNKINIRKPKGFISVFISETKFFSLLSVICIIAMSLYTKQFIPPVVITFLFIINTTMDSIRRHSQEKNLQEFLKLNPETVKVIREGKTISIDPDDLVVGDIVIISSGDIIPADLRIIEGYNLKVKQPYVTGQNYVVEKYETKIEEKEINIFEIDNMIFRSSIVVEGEGIGIVVQVGENSVIANDIKTIFYVDRKHMTLRKKIDRLISYMGLLALVISGGVLLIAFASNKDITITFPFITILLAASMPFGYNLVLYLIYSFIKKKIFDENIDFRDINTLEKVVSINAIAVDKVGALSEQEMILKKVYTDDEITNVYNRDVIMTDNLERLIQVGLLCNDTKMRDGRYYNPRGDLMEMGLVKFGMSNNIQKTGLQQAHEEILRIPYNKDKRLMMTINVVDKKYRANAKGTVDAILKNCTHIMKNGIEREITKEDVSAIKNADMEMSKECLSVIGIAYRNFNYEPSLDEKIESNLVFIGLIAFENPMQVGVDDTIRNSLQCGIKPIMITEDSKLTAYYVGKELNLLKNQSSVLSGVEIENAEEDEIQRNITKIRAFSRINSEQKIKIANYLKDNGLNIAMTGCKFVDISALKNANLGIGFGDSPMIRKLADVVFKDNNFNKIVHFVESSRKIIKCIGKIIDFAITTILSEIILLVALFSSGISTPINLFHVLWVNIGMLTIGSMIIVTKYKKIGTIYYPNEIELKGIREKIFIYLLKAVLIAIISIIAFFMTRYKGIFYSQLILFITLNVMLIITSIITAKTLGEL